MRNTPTERSAAAVTGRDSPALVLQVDVLTTPIGELLLAVDDTGALRVMHFADEDDPRRVLTRACHVSQVEIVPAQDPGGVTSALRGYFAGDLEAIDAVRVLASGTPFQREVWDLLRTIPCGTTTTYGALARRIGRPEASRAVGLANGSNPIAIVVPCHRVIGASGALTGYGGGLDRKRWLLQHEARRLF
jgi:methylated-DNA-[protein]-cysteine S-methyltransferase